MNKSAEQRRVDNTRSASSKRATIERKQARMAKHIVMGGGAK